MQQITSVSGKHTVTVNLSLHSISPAKTLKILDEELCPCLYKCKRGHTKEMYFKDTTSGSQAGEVGSSHELNSEKLEEHLFSSLLCFQG